MKRVFLKRDIEFKAGQELVESVYGGGGYANALKDGPDMEWRFLEADIEAHPEWFEVVEEPTDIPEGWELTGEYRPPKYQEYYCWHGKLCRCGLVGPHIEAVSRWMLRKVEEPEYEWVKYTVRDSGADYVAETPDSYERMLTVCTNHRYFHHFEYEDKQVHISPLLYRYKFSGEIGAWIGNKDPEEYEVIRPKYVVYKVPKKG